MVVKKWFNLCLMLSVVLLAATAFTNLKVLPAKAAGTIVVNSTADDQDNDGDCTLREAIIAANTDLASGGAAGECAAGSGADTIEFAIAGAADFTNNGQDGYTITPGSIGLPPIVSQVVINGYSQNEAGSVSAPNTATAPNPFNGTLLIRIDGGLVDPGVPALDFRAGSSNSVVKGLVINNLANGDAIRIVGSLGHTISGNYIGTNPAGTAKVANCIGLNAHTELGAGMGKNVRVGGILPADRNIISGNSGCASATASYPGTGWVFEGNYIGPAASGLAAIGNSNIGDSGGLSIDNSDSVRIGGTTAGAANVISGNLSMGLAPDTTTDLVVQGNYIGTDYTGNVALPNGGPGISSSAGTNTIIGGNTAAKRNIIAGNADYGVSLQNSTRFTLTGNYIGVASSLSALPNGNTGVNIDGGSGVVGGTATGEGNIIANAMSGFGVNVVSVSSQPHVSILGNSIYNNNDIGIGFNTSLLANDVGDIDTGPNDQLNFPDNVTHGESGGNTIMNYTLDVPAGQYRVEFFSNTIVDGSGYGEGKTFLGSQNVTTTGTGSQNYVHTLTGISIPNISATATLIDANQPSGYRMTSQFSAISTARPPITDISLTKTILNAGAVSAGGTVEYQLTVTNNGLVDLDLTQFNDPFASPFVADYLDPDLTLINLGDEWLIPGSYLVSDVGDPDLACVWGGPGSAAGVGLTTYGTYSFLTCTFAGTGDTTLAVGESLSLVLNVNVSTESDMVFSNYAIATPSLISDPDNASIAAIFGSGQDYLGLLIANQTSNDPINNFASAAYPVPVVQNPSSGGSTPSSILAQTGTNEHIWIVLAVLLMTSAGWLATKNLPYRSKR